VRFERKALNKKEELQMKNGCKVVLALLLAVMMLLTACASPADSDTPSAEPEGDAPSTGLPGEGKKIALITTIGGLGDGAIGDACYEGMTAAAEELGFEWDYSEPMSAPDYETLLIEYAESGEYDLIFLAGNDGLDPVTAVGADYPDQKYLVYDIAAEGNPQMISEYFAKNEIGFIAGVLAALMEEKGEVTIAGNTTTFEPTGKIGLIIGNEVPSTVTALTGAAAGIKYMKPDYEYLYGIVGDWKDQAKNKELALSMYDQGAHFIFQNAGGGGLGIIAAAKERGQFFIGYDKDQTAWDPERVIGSSRKQNTDTIVRVLREFCETGELAWGTAEENNAANGGIGFNYNPDLKVPEDVDKIIQQVIEDLKSGKIKAPNTWEEVEAFNQVYGG
jgi:basic membrane protein A